MEKPYYVSAREQKVRMELIDPAYLVWKARQRNPIIPWWNLMKVVDPGFVPF